MNIFWWLYRGNDITSYFLPDAVFFSQAISRGVLPIWNPWIFAGMPYLLDPQNLLWYPPNYIFLLMPVEIGFLILLIGHLVFAGWMINKILGNLGGLGYLGAAMYMFSPKLISHLEEGNWSLVIAAAWLPALYYGLKKKSYWWVVISLTAIIINNLNIGYYAILFTLFFFFVHRTKFLVRSDLEYSRSDLIKIILGVASLTLPRWLPLLLFGGQTVRASMQEAPLPFWSWMKIAKSLLFPLTAGHPLLQNEEILYVGIIPILLIVAYFVFKGRALRNFWIIWLVFILFVALNTKTPFYAFIEKLPGFSLLRITTRPWIFASLAVAVGTPIMLDYIWKKSKVLAILGILGVLIEFGIFDYGVFSRREIPKDLVPARFYRQMAVGGIPVRAYCTTGCLDRLTAQNMGITLLGGNNPIQLTEFVRYLEKSGGYREPTYHPILPPYTTFSQRPQPSAELLAKTSTAYVVSPYALADTALVAIDDGGGFILYRNAASQDPWRDHYFELTTIKD